MFSGPIEERSDAKPKQFRIIIVTQSICFNYANKHISGLLGRYLNKLFSKRFWPVSVPF